MDINMRIAGEAGQGIETTGEILTGVLADMGFYVFASKTYMSRIRGGLNWYDIRFGDRRLFSGRRESDLLISLTEGGAGKPGGSVSENGLLISDAGAGESDGCVCIPISETAKEAGGTKVMANMVAAGAVFGLLPYGTDRLKDGIKAAFEGKGKELVDKNLACAEAGAELAGGLSVGLSFPEPADAGSNICNGTEATALGAATAGVKFASGYPMTPATGVLTWLARHGGDYGILVEQAEDEIAAINMVLGASYAGVPALTATSGGGFALMTEGISLAGMLELPALVVLGQRPGPATGLPTRTAQQDLRFAIHAGHGEFPRAVFAPGTAEEAFQLTRRALETAHKYQSPAIVMIDQFFADSMRNVEPFDTALKPIDRCVESAPSADYARYAITESGVSPRALPGSDVMVKADSDEHDEEGHITEDLDMRIAQQNKRMRKEIGMIEDWAEPVRHGPSDAGHVLVVWGSTFGPCREAVDMLNASDGAGIAMVHFPQVWPLDVERARAAIKGDYDARPHITCVEGNATAQFGGVLREQGIVDDYDKILKYNGMPFTGEEIAEKIKID